jgi:hypothetical protein
MRKVLEVERQVKTHALLYAALEQSDYPTPVVKIMPSASLKRPITVPTSERSDSIRRADRQRNRSSSPPIPAKALSARDIENDVGLTQITQLRNVGPTR